MKKLLFMMIALLSASELHTIKAQNMSQLQAINNLTGFWTTEATGNIPLSTFDFVNKSNPASRSLITSGFASKSYDNWGIHTNTFNFATGVIQATNTNPFRNDNYNYRNLTAYTCDFQIQGVWVKARKNTVEKTEPSNNGNNRPVINNNNVNMNDEGSYIVKPTDIPSTIAPTNNNQGSNRPATNNNQGNERPKDNNNNNNNNQSTNRPVVIATSDGQDINISNNNLPNHNNDNQGVNDISAPMHYTVNDNGDVTITPIYNNVQQTGENTNQDNNVSNQNNENNQRRRIRTGNNQNNSRNSSTTNPVNSIRSNHSRR